MNKKDLFKDPIYNNNVANTICCLDIGMVIFLILFSLLQRELGCFLLGFNLVDAVGCELWISCIWYFIGNIAIVLFGNIKFEFNINSKQIYFTFIFTSIFNKNRNTINITLDIINIFNTQHFQWSFQPIWRSFLMGYRQCMMIVYIIGLILALRPFFSHFVRQIILAANNITSITLRLPAHWVLIMFTLFLFKIWCFLLCKNICFFCLVVKWENKKKVKDR